MRDWQARKSDTIVVIALFLCMQAHGDNPQPHVAIIGAGMAGLTTAWNLSKQGFTNVDVYEARQRVGGRVFSIELADEKGHIGYAELGGENILDGGQAEHTRALIKELGLECIEGVIQRAREVYDQDGRSLNPQDIIRNKYNFTPEILWEKLQILQKSSISMEEVVRKLFPDDQVLHSHFGLRLQGYEGGSLEQLSSCYVITLYHMLLGALCSAHADAGSIAYLMVKGGNNRLAQTMAATLGNKIHLNAALTKLEKDTAGGYIVHFANGTCAHADIIVLAIPASVYDSIDIAQDIIPADRLTAMKKIPYGQHSKIVVPIAPEEMQRSFHTHYMLAFTGRQGDYAVLFYPNEYGYFTRDTLISTFKRDLPYIQRWYKVPPLRDPVLAQDCYLKAYNCPVGHSWHHDPYARGTYSYVGVGQDEIFLAMCDYKGQWYRKLFLPCNDDTLFFAGEHTTRLIDVLGTIEAAVESGKHTARSIIKLYQDHTMSEMEN